jgi:hypothetical protein
MAGGRLRPVPEPGQEPPHHLEAEEAVLGAVLATGRPGRDDTGMSRDRGPSSLAFRPRVRLGTPRLRRDGRALANTLRSIVRRRQQLDAEIKSHKQLMDSPDQAVRGGL